MFVIPKKGLVVRDPVTKRTLPESGAEVPESGYWMRRLRDRDISRSTPPSPAKSNPVAAAPAAPKE